MSQAEYCPHDGSLLVTDHEIPDPLLGEVLLEQFRIDEQIGTGGMGTVYRAHQTTVGRNVAIKVLRQELARDEQAVSRFEREARLAIALDHPNLVRVFLTGRLADGRLYIVMELLEGRSLAEELEQNGPPSMDRAVILLMKLCAALGAVHAAGVVHRDIKPENVYLVRRGKDEDFVKLVDFGIARVLQTESADPSTTQGGRVFGTASYISPEAATGDRTDHRSDIYSLGVLAYQLLTGELPFEGSTTGALLMQHVHRAPPPMSTKGRGAEVPEALARVVMRSLRKDPDARQQTLAELLDSLAEAAGRAGLLNDGRALLLGTVWGDELAAPGSYLAELLASSTPPTGSPALADTAFARDPREEAFLSSAPAPFGTTGHDLAAIRGLEGKPHSRGWMLLGLTVLAVVGVAVGTWWRYGAPQSSARSTVSAPVLPMAPKDQSATETEEIEVPEANVALEALPLQPSQEAPIGVDQEKASQQANQEIPPTTASAAEPPPKAKKRRASAVRRKKPHAKASKSQPKSRPAPEPASVLAPDSGSASESASAPELEPDEGIDWTVPGFPEQPPTGMPQAPPPNPIVIDEPPAR